MSHPTPMRGLQGVLVPVTLAACVVVACGDEFSFTRTGGPGAGGQVGVGGAAASSSTDAASTSTDAASASTDAANSSTDAASASTDAASASVVASSSSMAASSSSGGGVSKKIPCGNAGECANVCCFGLKQSCANDASGCVGLQARLECDDTADCQGIGVCCGFLDVTWKTQCAPSCGFGQFQLCRQGSECPNPNQACSDVKTVTFPPGFQQCGG